MQWWVIVGLICSLIILIGDTVNTVRRARTEHIGWIMCWLVQDFIAIAAIIRTLT